MKTLLITGASRGIGLACLRLLAAEYKIVAVSRTPPPPHPQVTHLPYDLSNSTSLAKCVETLRSYELDGGIFCAGRGLFRQAEQISCEQAEELFRLNFFSPAFLAKALLPRLKSKRRADLLFIGSIAAKKWAKCNTFYGASKAALHSFVHSLRKECSSSGVKISLLHPGMCSTPFYDELDFQPKNAPGHAIDPEDIAQTVAFVLRAPPSTVYEEISITPQKEAIEKKRRMS
ncbi:MAG: SDR family oxidoreductase [Chlamydiota bacterium]